MKKLLTFSGADLRILRISKVKIIGLLFKEKFMKKIFSVAVLSIMLVAFVGCIKSVDPVTGIANYSLDPNSAAKVDVVLAAGQGIGMAISSVAPEIGGLLLAALAAGGAVWRNLKPKLTEATDKAQKYYDATSTTVSALEKFKTEYPEDWEKLSPILEKCTGVEVENVIRALRNLPPKV
jgi:hypothetical protein